ncbi:hypothetical protein [Nonomuraea sp. 10N515B]|uniref:hypothetical protein n=1 Tax=Nonomuraea sp. 10N515B TaxID=3457422 RepID=UPI003FCD41FB
MTVSFRTDPNTADLLLYANPQKAGEELTRRMDGALDEIRQQVRTPPGELADKAATAGVELLRGINVGSVLLSGWATYRNLRAAARRTLDNPGTGQMVPLVDHEVVSRHEPSVEVQVNGQPVGRLRFGIDLVLHVTGLQASVRNGRLIRLTGGDCVASAVCKVQGVEVARQDYVLVTLPINRDLGEGYPILREARAAAGAGNDENDSP